MSQLETIKRHGLIVKKIRKANYATFKEINDYLKQQSEYEGLNLTISKRTFQRDLDDIGSIYGIYIKFDFSKKYYFIEFEDESEAEISSKMFEAFDMYNALNVKEQLSKYIHFEPNRSQGIGYFNSILNAIKRNQQISFSYQKFYKNFSEERTVNPIILKEYKHRWYIVAEDTGDSRIKFYALDRMSNLEVRKTKFQPKDDFDINEFVKYCYGVMLPPNEEPYAIELSFEPFQGKYIKTLPFHSSQKTLIDNEEEFRISLFMYITPDFIMELLALGDTLTVIKPLHLIDILKNRYKKSLEKYEK